MQVDLVEGPCVDAATTRLPVLMADLTDPRGHASERWPFFLPRADALGVRGLFAFPLLVGPVVLGTLELYRFVAGVMAQAQVDAAVRASDDLGSRILDVGGPQWPQDGEAPAAVVHQATGMVMVQIDGTIEGAMARLRARAFVEGVTVTDVAEDVVGGRLHFHEERT